MLRTTLVGAAIFLGCSLDEALGAALHGQRLQQHQQHQLEASNSSASTSTSRSSRSSSGNSTGYAATVGDSTTGAGPASAPGQALAINLNQSLPAFASHAKGPVRGLRGGDTVGEGKRLGVDSEWGDKGAIVSECFLTAKVHSGSDKEKVCPEECPYFVQDRQDWDFCTFACVPETHCSHYNPETPIADKEIGFCRSCTVAGCAECDNSVNFDQCSKCSPGYYLKGGECWFKYGGDWVYVTAGILVGVVLLVAVWLCEWGFRPTTNQAGLDHALLQRERCKLKMKKEGTGERKEFPLTTNLLKEQVAGPGMTLHFNFQVFLMIWGVFVALVWICFAAFVDEDLWRLGTRKFGNPRENCILVMWGYERQQDLMWTKVAFLWIVYIGSFSMCMAYGVYQLRCFQGVDHQHKTMKDFVAMVVGLPSIPGFKDVEGELKKCLENTTGQSLAGVSVAWDWQEHQEAVETALEEDLNERVFLGGPSGVESNDEQDMGFLRSTFFKMEKGILGLGEEGGSIRNDDGFGQGALAATGGSDELPIEQMLQELHTSPRAFAVFETQEAKERAVAAIADLGGFDFEGASGIALEELEAEPDTVQWIYYGHSTRSQKIVRLVAGFGCIILACLFWAVVFYAPYAYYVMTFNYENGREPGFIVGFAFSMIVVVGNAIMYEVCARISDKVGFQFKDDKEACYMILYTIACLFNVALDFVTTYYTAEKVMEGLGFRTYFGTPLADINHFTTKFETYGMQRSLAENTYSYAFPSTYLIPFLIEPAPTILAPLLLGRLIVRTHPEVQGKEAEEWMAMTDMEMGRYADLLLNVILGILIFYFPGGYTWMLFLAMAASHVWIYAFDHFRVLRSIPACTFAAYDIEWWCQAMLAPIMGIIASCLAFKSNCEPGMYCLAGTPLLGTCSLAWLLHTILQTVCLVYLVPMCGKRPPEEDPSAHETFTSLSQRVPCNWFTANPIWCLRSKFKFKHSPACSFYQLGKERYMKYSPKTGCFFDEQDSSPLPSNQTDVKWN